MLLLHFLRELSQDDAMDKDDAIRLLKSLILIQKLIMFAATAVAPAAPSAPAAFYNRHGVPAEARREQMDRGDALNWQDIDVRFKLDGTSKCLAAQKRKNWS